MGRISWLGSSVRCRPEYEYAESKRLYLLNGEQWVGCIHICPLRSMDMTEVNFLCVHKKLRSKRMAVILIKEITRRCNIRGIFQAVYTAGALLPKPVGTCR